MLVAFLIRIWDVGARAMHLDESTVAWFGWQLATGHGYSYDPVYHGPFQHEMLALIFLLFEPSQTSARLLAVLLGTGLVALPWFVRDFLGTRVALLSSFLIAISPSFVYFARFERDDSYMEFFTFLVVVFGLRFLRDRRPWQLYALTAAIALAFATKESIYIVLFIFASYIFFLSLGSLAANRLRRPITGAGNRWLPGSVLVAFAAALAVALAVTPPTELFLPVPLITMALLATAVASTGTSLIVRAHGHRRREPVSREQTLEIQSESQPADTSKRVLKHSTFDSLFSLERRHWINAATLALGIIVLMYSTFGTDLNGLWDRAHPFFNSDHACSYSLAFHLDACRKDIIGGLFYWLSQHKVARGGQPWYYYLLLYGLYEQVAVLLALFAIFRSLVVTSLSVPNRVIRVFFGYWAVLALMIYSWAGEKFPWLGIHPLLPITVLAAFGIDDLIGLAAARVVRRPGRARVRRGFAGVALLLVALLLIQEVHNTLTLNFLNGANPVEMMVYVQSAPDTIVDANRIDALSHQATGGSTLPVTIDTIDAWPFAWYLRDMPDVGYPTGSQAVKPPYSTNPVVILDQADAQDLNPPKSLTSKYTRSLRRLDWWFPENYKLWTWSTLGRDVLDSSKWQAIWSWELWRTPFGPRDGSWYYLYVKKGKFPKF